MLAVDVLTRRTGLPWAVNLDDGLLYVIDSIVDVKKIRENECRYVCMIKAQQVELINANGIWWKTV